MVELYVGTLKVEPLIIERRQRLLENPEAVYLSLLLAEGGGVLCPNLIRQPAGGVRGAGSSIDGTRDS